VRAIAKESASTLKRRWFSCRGLVNDCLSLELRLICGCWRCPLSFWRGALPGSSSFGFDASGAGQFSLQICAGCGSVAKSSSWRDLIGLEKVGAQGRSPVWRQKGARYRHDLSRLPHQSVGAAPALPCLGSRCCKSIWQCCYSNCTAINASSCCGSSW
jgi:hypothetical protein